MKLFRSRFYLLTTQRRIMAGPLDESRKTETMNITFEDKKLIDIEFISSQTLIENQDDTNVIFDVECELLFSNKFEWVGLYIFNTDDERNTIKLPLLNNSPKKHKHLAINCSLEKIEILFFKEKPIKETLKHVCHISSYKNQLANIDIILPEKDLIKNIKKLTWFY